LYNQIHTGNVAGNATGRNVHGRSLEQAIAMTKAISAITLDDTSVDEAAALVE